MEAPNKLNVLKMSGEYMRNKETAIQYGFPLLLEDVGEVLTPRQPLLLKQHLLAAWIVFGCDATSNTRKCSASTFALLRNRHKAELMARSLF